MMNKHVDALKKGLLTVKAQGYFARAKSGCREAADGIDLRRPKSQRETVRCGQVV